MNKVSWLKDMLESKVYRQQFCNENMLRVTNPEARQLLAQIRDDEMRQIILLQQKIDALSTPNQPITISPFK